jgi:hypothetical protein
MEVANAPAYYDTATITAIKSFIVQGPGSSKIKLFAVVINPLCVCQIFVGKARKLRLE